MTVKLDSQLEKIATDCVDVSNDVSTLKKDVQTLSAKVDNISTDRVTVSSGGYLKFWTGTQSQYDSIYSKDSNTIYFITE